MPVRLRADFNGLFDDLLCMSHSDTCTDEHGSPVVLQEGMQVVAFESDPEDDDTPNWIVAAGAIEPAPEWMSCRGSKWVLRIDAAGVHNVSELAALDVVPAP